MSYACYCDWDDEGTRYYATETRRARKAYRCEECGGPIAPGDTYEVAKFIDDYGWSQFRTCQPCLDGPVAFIRKNCGCFIHGGEWMEDHLTNVFTDHDFQHPGVKFRVGRMLVELRRRRGMTLAAA